MTRRDRTAKVGSVGDHESARVGRFVALREPRYRTLFLSGMIIFLATHAQQIARGWLAKELTGSNAGRACVPRAAEVGAWPRSRAGGIAKSSVSKIGSCHPERAAYDSNDSPDDVRRGP